MKLIVLLLFFSFQASAYTNYEADFSIIPIELQYMVTSLNSYSKDHPGANHKELNAKMTELNNLMRSFRKAEIYFIIKTEVYKSIYEISPGDNFASNNLNFGFAKLEKKFRLQREAYPFVYFLIYGLFTDFKFFKSETPAKSRLATPWLNFLNENDFIDATDSIRKLIINIIDRLIIKFKFYSFENIPGEKFGIIITVKEQKEEMPNKKSVETITNNVIQKIANPTKKDTKFSFSNLPMSELFPDPDPNYTIPKNLPKPTNDWKD